MLQKFLDFFDALNIFCIDNSVVKRLKLADFRISRVEPTEEVTLLVCTDSDWKLITGKILRITEDFTHLAQFGWTLHGLNHSSCDINFKASSNDTYYKTFL